MAIDPAARHPDVGAPAPRHEPDRRIVRDTPRATAVELPQHLDGLEQLLAFRIGAKTERLKDARREVAGGAVTLAELLQMTVLERAFDLGGELERALQLLRSRAVPHSLANLGVGDLRIEEDLEQLAEQDDRSVRAVRDAQLARYQRPAGLRVLCRDAIVEQVGDLIGHPGNGLSAEREQRRMAKRRVAAADCLARRVANVLGEHPATVRRNDLKIPLIGAECA